MCRCEVGDVRSGLVHDCVVFWIECLLLCIFNAVMTGDRGVAIGTVFLDHVEIEWISVRMDELKSLMCCVTVV